MAPDCSRHCRCHGHWWVMARSPRELHVMRFCMTLGPPLVNGGGGGGTRCLPIVVAVALRRRSCRWVVAITCFCVMWGSALGIGVSRQGCVCQIGDGWAAYLYTAVAAVTPGRCSACWLQVASGAHWGCGCTNERVWGCHTVAALTRRWSGGHTLFPISSAYS